jgi:hypothetical protein
MLTVGEMRRTGDNSWVVEYKTDSTRGMLHLSPGVQGGVIGKTRYRVYWDEY